MSKDDQIAVLQDRVVELEELLGVGPSAIDQYAKLGLSPIERQVLGYIVKRDVATAEGMFQAIYGARADCDQPVDAKEAIGVRVYRVRNALDPLGIGFDTIYKVGWVMSAENKKKLADLLDGEQFKHRQPRDNKKTRGERRFS